ncbi:MULTISPECIES: transcriptional initiation protein Tat [unclassified Haloferax]|uniref:transcriptional initiation protein Tat n=1 Tax=unclassified Haloferax TaxID=2625095 RepID=UPI000E2699F4|nr:MULTISPECIES: transcriptional initiation protein Tat [unclassified Haloferax]RDZ34551.1 transcriptional initiation protein Tat [Haloferax sp. Atlit-24N]RLM34962.1 transcriptional initiation protein Tat [Haloferax sp. Atlit-109R]RLM42814.1 transcriptional initiation protein Tat [Haloferax sp. Atlit-105R]
MSPDDAPPADDSPSDERSSLSRRQLLGLVGGAGAVGGIGWFRPTWLPDPITDWLTTVYPDPSSNYVWQPPVSDEHADAAVANLESVVERAEELRSQVDLDSVDEDMRFHLRGSPAGGHLESAKEERNARHRLRSATTGLQYAGETVGYATIALGDDDPEFLVERGRELEQEIDDLAASVSEYRVSDPGRDLAFLYSIERLLSVTRLTVGWGDSDGGESMNYSAHDFAGEWGSQLQAQQRLRTARYHREQYRSNLGADTIPYRDRLADAIDAFWTRIDEYPRRSEVRTTIEEERDLDQSTPYGAARWELFTLCFDNDARYVGEYERGLTAKQFVDTARALLARRAHDFALDALDVDPGDTDYDSGRSFRAKRRAMRNFRATRDEYDSPIAGIVASEAASRIRAGDVSLEMGDGPAWKERVESAVYYLVGAGMMRELGNVVEPVVNRDAT